MKTAKKKHGVEETKCDLIQEKKKRKKKMFLSLIFLLRCL